MEIFPKLKYTYHNINKKKQENKLLAPSVFRPSRKILMEDRPHTLLLISSIAHWFRISAWFIKLLVTVIPPNLRLSRLDENDIL